MSRIRSESIKVRCECRACVCVPEPWEKRLGVLFFGWNFFWEPGQSLLTEGKKGNSLNDFFLPFKMKGACAHATGIRQQILRAQSSAALL